jgi:phospholipid transport system transporter-binding protein
MALIEQQGRRLVVRGVMTVDTVSNLLAEGVALLAGEIEIDLGEVGEVDSSALSLLFEWLRQAQILKAGVVYSNLPPTLISLATLYGVLELIPQRMGAVH